MAQTTNIPAVPVRTPFFLSPAADDFTREGVTNWRLSRTWLLFFQQLGAPAGRRLVAVFDTVVAGQSTNYLLNDATADLTPTALNLSAVGASGTGNSLFQIETSADLVTWTSILTADATLPTSAHKLTSPITSFTSGAVWKVGQWIRARVDTGSATDATQVSLQLNCIPS